jgi:hypothetical protein
MELTRNTLMEKYVLRTSKDWCNIAHKKYKLIIYDADGWDRRNYEHSFNQELIDKNEFMNRVSRSTTMCPISFFTNF